MVALSIRSSLKKLALNNMFKMAVFMSQKVYYLDILPSDKYFGDFGGINQLKFQHL